MIKYGFLKSLDMDPLCKTAKTWLTFSSDSCNSLHFFCICTLQSPLTQDLGDVWAISRTKLAVSGAILSDTLGKPSPRRRALITSNAFITLCSVQPLRWQSCLSDWRKFWAFQLNGWDKNQFSPVTRCARSCNYMRPISFFVPVPQRMSH